MSDHKTLKDFANQLEKGKITLIKENLKLEAIKEIKRISKLMEEEKYGTEYWETYFCAQIDWIKHFFNIPEEDL